MVVSAEKMLTCIAVKRYFIPMCFSKFRPKVAVLRIIGSGVHWTQQRHLLFYERQRKRKKSWQTARVGGAPF